MDTEPVRDSVRAAVLEEVPPCVVRGAVAALEGEAYRGVLLAGLEWSRRVGFSGALDLDEELGTTPLADSALAARYDAATTAALNPLDLRRQAYRAMMADAPPFVESQFQAMGITDALTTEQGPEDRAFSVHLARQQLAGADPADLEAVTSFFESPAGRLVGRAVALGTLRATLPAEVEQMRESFRELEHLLELRRRVEASPESADSLLDAAGVPAPDDATITVNAARVRAAAVYPPDARADNVEGDVLVRVTLDADGSVLEAEVLESPDPRLSRAVLEAVRAVEFRPPARLRDGRRPITFSVPFRPGG